MSGVLVRGLVAAIAACFMCIASQAQADLTPPAIDAVPCDSCRGDASDIDACDRALDEEQDEKAIELCSRGLRSQHLSEYDRAIGHHNRGAAYYYTGDYRRAVQDFSEAIRLMPELVVAYNGRGVAHEELG